MIDYNKLGKYIDNIYTGSSDSSSRKVIASLSNNTLTLNFRSIVNVGRKEELEKRKKELENEAIQLISKKKKEISDGYNNEAETKIKLKETNTSKVQNSCFELLTLSHISPVRTYKFSCCKCFDFLNSP